MEGDREEVSPDVTVIYPHSRSEIVEFVAAPAAVGNQDRLPGSGTVEEEELPDELPFEPPNGSKLNFRGIDPQTDELMVRLSGGRLSEKTPENEAGRATPPAVFTEKDQEELHSHLFRDELLGSEGNVKVQEDSATNNSQQEVSVVAAPAPKQLEKIVIEVPEEKEILPAEKTSDKPGEDEVEAVADTYVGKHRQRRSRAKRLVDNAHSYVPGAKEYAKEKRQMILQLGATALRSLKKRGEHVKGWNRQTSIQAKTKKMLDDLRGRVPGAKERSKEHARRARQIGATALTGVKTKATGVYLSTMGFQEKVFFNEATGKRNRNILRAAIGTVLLAGLAYVTYKGVSGHDHGAASGNQHPGPNAKPTPNPTHLTQPGVKQHPGPSHGGGGATQLSTGGPKKQPEHHPLVQSLHAGSTISNQVQDQLNSMGAHYNTHQLYEVVGKTLQHNNVTYPQAHFLPVGFHTQLLHPEQIKELLEKSKG